jgi:hypothetical protein
LAQKGTKYSILQKDEDVNRWLKGVRRGSPITAEVSLRRLGKLCELLSTTPKGLVKSAKKNLKKFQDSLDDMVTKLESENKSPGYILDLLKTLRSWLRYNDIQLMRKIQVSNPNATPTIENEQIPTQTELAKILRTAPPRIRVAIALMAYADLRPESIGNHNGTDGIALKDLPEIKIRKLEVTFEKIPTMITIRSPLSKTRIKYFTFLSQEGCNYLKEYLEERLRNGEKLSPETPLIGHERPGAAEKKFAMTRKISHFIRKYMRAAGVYKRPYVLRAYAETQLIIAESKGKISHPYLQFIAGHKGDIEARYSTNKGILPPDMIEDMRSMYKECEPFLNSSTINPDQNDLVKQVKLESLKSIAKNVFGIDLQDLLHQKEIETKTELTPEIELETIEEALKQFREDIPVSTSIEEFRKGYKIPSIDETKSESKLVSEDELEDYLNNGWDMIQTINSKILIRKRIQ